MAKAYMQVDLNNPLAVRYHERALESFQPVEDVFKIEVIQCITPDTLLEELSFISPKSRSPQEMGSFHSNYRMIKRISKGEVFWIMEHDAYLHPEHEQFFRNVLLKQSELSTLVLGMGTEIWTTIPEVASEYIHYIKKRTGNVAGPMACLHAATDIWAKKIDNDRNIVYWPMNHRKDSRWINLTGVGKSVTEAGENPAGCEWAPCTQIVDEKYGGTVIDRPKTMRNGKYDKSIIYNPKAHPDVKWVSLDND